MYTLMSYISRCVTILTLRARGGRGHVDLNATSERWGGGEWLVVWVWVWIWVRRGVDSRMGERRGGEESC